MTLYRNALAASGKPDPEELPVIKEVFCAKDRKTALEMAGPYLAGKYQAYAKWGQDKVMPESETFDQEFETLITDRFIVGSPEECYEQLRPYWEEFGVNHLLIRTHWAGMPLSTALHSIRMISDELLPALHAV
jgi:alkanesulfonate monooxygenase SsuD/methylene tetrahydromethanopterin reductase-like flavin-dependent oxidoreductase (luciferase family)